MLVFLYFQYLISHLVLFNFILIYISIYIYMNLHSNDDFICFQF